MSLTTAIATAVSGMNAQSKSISTVSGNLANSSTTAYKSGTTMFEEMVSSEDTVSTSVSAATHYYNGAQGTITSVDSDTYMAISGNGYFAVKAASTDADGNVTLSDETYYTRSGDFSVNSDGYLVNGEGYYLMGWSVDPTTGTVNESTLVPVQISDLLNASVTTANIDYTANLPASADDGSTTSSSTVEVYDSTGTAHNVSFSWTKVDTSTWELTVTGEDASYDSDTDITSDYSAVYTVTFDENGNIESVEDNGSGSTIDGTSIGLALSYDGADAQAVTLDLSGITQQEDDAYSVTSLSQDGVAEGSFSSVSIDSSGNISVEYDNDVSLTYYELPLAVFTSADNLSAVSGNAYLATTTSGAATYTAVGTNGAGSLSTSSLESSNVDIASEFTTLVVAQQAYSANSKTITTVDSMLQNLIDLSA